MNITVRKKRIPARVHWAVVVNGRHISHEVVALLSFKEDAERLVEKYNQGAREFGNTKAEEYYSLATVKV